MESSSSSNKTIIKKEPRMLKSVLLEVYTHPLFHTKLPPDTQKLITLWQTGGVDFKKRRMNVYILRNAWHVLNDKTVEKPIPIPIGNKNKDILDDNNIIEIVTGLKSIYRSNK